MTISEMMPADLVQGLLHPDEVAAAVASGARVVDIRSQAERTAQGPLVGAVAVAAHELLDRLDPAGPRRIGWAASREVPWVVVSARGHGAAAAAEALRRAGLANTVALIGGFASLKALNLFDAVSGGLHTRRDAAAIAAH